MGWLEGVLTGYADRHYEIAKQKREEAEQAAQREGQIYQTLLNSEYPEIKDLAGAGILDLANPRKRKGGIAGWMGEMQQSPYLDAVRRAREHIAGDPEYAQSALGRGAYPALGGERGAPGGPPTTPSIPTPAGSAPGAAPGAPPLALPSTSQVTGGPATPVTPAPPPPPSPAFPQGMGARPPAWGIPDPGTGPPSFAQRYGSLGMSGETYGQPQAGPPAPPYGPIASDEPGLPADAAAATLGPPQAPTEPGGPGGPPVAPTSPGGPPVPPGMDGQTNPAMAPDLAQAAAMAPAGPPLQTARPTPPTPGLVAEGLPGATVRPVGRPGALAASRTQLPGIFPSTGDLLRQKETGEIMGQVQGWQMLYRELGDPDWQQKGLQAVLDQKKRGAGMGALHEGNVRQNAQGEWVQDLYDPATGELVNSIPALGPSGGGSVQSREAIAFTRFGKPGEDPRATIRRLTPTQMATVIEAERVEKGMAAAEVSLRRAEAMSNAPLAAQAKSALIETLNGKWQQLQKPIRESQRSFNSMVTGLQRFRNGDAQGGSEMIRVAFERILDPTSVVREGEYARQVDGLSSFQRLNGWWQSVVAGGGKIEVDQLAGMVETMRQFMESLQGWNDLERGRIEDRATANGIDPAFIFGGGVQTPPPPPAAGTGTTPAATPTAPGGGGGVGLDTEYEMDPATGRRRIKR